MIKSINFEIIDICNLKCNMCDIWKNTQKNIITLFDFKNILESNNITTKTNITLTWWEPILHTNIKEIFQIFHDKWLMIHTLSTNWIIYEKIEDLLYFCITKGIQKPNIHISIDWLEKKHDLQRGIPWSYAKSLNTIILLKKRFKYINIKIKYTITKNNIYDIEKIFILSKKLWVNIDFKIVEFDNYYTNKIDKPILLDKKDKINVINILKNIYNNSSFSTNLINYLEYDKLWFKCTTPNNNLFIMANWETYCCTKYKSIWNVKQEKLDNILYNNIHKKIINKVEKTNCNKCYSLHWSFKSII